MKYKELTGLSKEEQENKLKELRLELIKLNAQVATGTPPKNAGQLKRLKKDIARIMFIQGTKKKIDEINLIQKKTKESKKQVQKNQGAKAQAQESKIEKKTSEKTK
jgi:ribosomal protein L29